MTLLDTNVALWALATPERLSPAARKRIEAGSCIVSAASYWEVVIKTRKGMLKVGDPVRWWESALESLHARPLSIQPAHVERLWTLPDHHRDPFDRILIAQAIAEKLTLVTNDPAVSAYPVQLLW